MRGRVKHLERCGVAVIWNAEVVPAPWWLLTYSKGSNNSHLSYHLSVVRLVHCWEANEVAHRVVALAQKRTTHDDELFLFPNLHQIREVPLS